MTWPTTRRYPRTLQEAFPRDSQWAYPCHRTTRLRVLARRTLSVVTVLSLFALLAFTLLEWAAQ